MSETTVAPTPADALQLLDEAAADTVAFYVKENLTLRDFFRRKQRNSRTETFAIQAAENEGMRAVKDQPE
ncbi:hypothetical protein [Roseibium sp. LAB1]